MAGHDRVQRGDERLGVFGARLRFTRQGFLRMDRILGREPWAGQEFGTDRWRVMGEVQLQRWISLNAFWNGGDEGTIDRFGPHGAAVAVGVGNKLTARLQSGYLYSYALVMLLGLIGAASWAVWWAK